MFNQPFRGIRDFAYVLCLFVAVAGVSSCGTIAKDIATNLAQMPGQDVNAVIPVGSIQAFEKCLINPGGACFKQATQSTLEISGFTTDLKPTLDAILGERPLCSGAKSGGDTGLDRAYCAARSVLDSNTHTQLLKTYEKIVLSQQKSSEMKISEMEQTVSMELSWNELTTYSDAVCTATLLGGWDVFAQRVDEGVKRKGLNATETDVFAQRTAIYIQEYMKAYFRGGKFISAKLDLNTAIAQLKEKLAAMGIKVEEVDPDLLAKLLKYGHIKNGELVFVNMEDMSFITRGGAKYQFPGFSVQFAPVADHPFTFSKVDAKAIGSDLIRVVLEATFDAANQLPCVSNATAANLSKQYCHDPNHPEQKDWRLKVNDQNSTNSPHLKEDDFGSVEKWASSAEAGASTLTGHAVRGAGILALNNEALAQLVETIVGVLARKLTEKAAWCAYSCAQPPLKSEQTMFYGDSNMNLIVRIRGSR